jgi:hypothetical protein
MKDKVRAFLDDEVTMWKQGSMWSDDQIYAALDAAQLAFVRYSYMKEQWHLISRLHSSTGGISPHTLPADYMFYASATVDAFNPLSPAPPFLDPHPAVLYIGWSGSIYASDEIRYVAYIKNNIIEFRNGLNSGFGDLYYYKRPTKVTAASNHTEMIDACYDAIVYHGVAMLQQKDWGQCSRFLKNMNAILKSVMSEPTGMYPQNLNENTDA